MNPETKNCQNCKNDFTIESDDFAFYDKMKVPPPTFCPECRFKRRLAFMNVYSLYKRPCDKCGVSTVSMFHKDKKQIVYCSKCWWADDWDGTENAMDYDPNRNFLEQFYELKQKTPHMALDTLFSSLVNTSYTNYSSHLKNTYALFFADYAESSFYSDFLNTIKDTSDCHRIRESELCYGSVGMFKCFGCLYSLECDSSVNLIFSKNCSNCTDCFGCMNLKNKSYNIFNNQYSKEEYFAFIKDINISSHQTYLKYKKQAEDFWLTQPNRSYYGNSLNVNVSGNYVYESRNAKDVYQGTSIENSRYVQFISVPSTKDSYDYTCWGGNSERAYEALIAGHGTYDIKFSIASYPDCMSNEYCYYASSCKNVFGCVNLKKKTYSILNKEYPKEEYEKLREQIIEDMKNHPYKDKNGLTYSYGEFFPLELSSFGYNETMAQQYFPITQEEAAASGYNWFNSIPNEYTPTILAVDLPDSISDLSDPEVLKEVIKCSCGRCYQIVQGEVNVLRKLNLPLPHKCPECRRLERFSHVLPPKEYDRKCAKCSIDIKTSYAPDRPEVIYCEKCYQQEVY